jgi:hypothetical protein
LDVQEALVKKSQEEKKRKNDLERKRGEAAADWRLLALLREEKFHTLCIFFASWFYYNFCSSY